MVGIVKCCWKMEDASRHRRRSAAPRCAAPRCVGKLDGELISVAPVKDPVRYPIWAKFAGIVLKEGKIAKNFSLCSKHFEKKYFNMCNGKAFGLLRGATPIPTIHCEGPDMPNDCPEVTAEDSNVPTSATISRRLDEAVRLTAKVETENNSMEDNVGEIHSEPYESLPDVPPSSNQGILDDSNYVPCHIIEELPEMYSLITLPYLEQANTNLKWLYKILSGEEGRERVDYMSPNKDDKDGFMLIRDSKWDGKNLDNLHVVAVAYRPGIMCLRDVNRKHLRLLQNINLDGKEFIMRKYGVAASQLRVFLQYPPSFYHLHVHFTAINDHICGPHYGTAHPLSSVIHNICASPSYYMCAPLNLCLKESDELFLRFESQGIVQRVKNFS